MKKLFIEILKNEVKPAMGCTEPIAVAFAAAKAKEILEQDGFDQMVVKVSPNFYKNGLAVGIPHTTFIGLDIAAIVGFIDGDASSGLEVLKKVDDEKIKHADRLLPKVDLKVEETEESVYIHVTAIKGSESAEVVIQGKHDQIIAILKNGHLIHRENVDVSKTGTLDLSKFYELKVMDIVETVEKMDYKSLEFMLKGYEMNKAIALEGLRVKHGFGIGYNIKKLVDEGIIGNDLVNQASILTAAASDARMDGVNMPVMSSNGSGNNGITAILPIVAYAEMHRVSDEKIAKAIAISHLINNYIKKEIGRLSAMCSCSVSAGSSASAAIVWLKGGSKEAIEGTIKNMIGNVSGMICDGAKRGCAIKLSTAANLSVMNAELSMKGSVVGHKNGIVNHTVEKTIKNLGILSRKGMKLTDTVILDIMKNND
jgi:L-cysteine desulfidase